MHVNEGVVLLEHQGLLRDGDALAKLIRRVARLAMALSLQGPAVVDRLGANVVTDGNPLVRLRNLEILLSRYADSKSTELACQHALGDRSYPVRVLAAEHSGDEGMETMRQVVQDKRAPLELRTKCVDVLEDRLDPTELVELLSVCLGEDEALRERAIVGLAESGHDPGTEILLTLLERAIPSGWMSYAKAISALERVDLSMPLEVLLDESRGDGWISLLDGSPRDEPSTSPTDDESVESPGVLISEELLVDQEVRSAVRKAMRSLRGWEWEADQDEDEATETSADDVLTNEGSATPLDAAWALRMALDNGEQALEGIADLEDDDLGEG